MHFDTLTWVGLSISLVITAVLAYMCKRQGCNKPVQ